MNQLTYTRFASYLLLSLSVPVLRLGYTGFGIVLARQFNKARTRLRCFAHVGAKKRP